MKIVIAGAGVVGTHLAKMLSSNQNSITVIDDKNRYPDSGRQSIIHCRAQGSRSGGC